jgi:SAM-dependent methyltransferase
VLEIGPEGNPSGLRQSVNEVEVWDTLGLAAHPLRFVQEAPEQANLTYVSSSPYEFPVDDDSYDVVVSGNVIEHVAKPWRWVPELARIAKPGGVVITIAPVSWPYHKSPIDCWRMYPDGLEALYEDAGLETVMSTWGSLETPKPRRPVPGRSEISLPGKWRWYSKIGARLWFPVERSYDSIAVGRKRLT